MRVSSCLTLRNELSQEMRTGKAKDFTGISGCSDGVSQEGSASSTKSTELLLGKFSDLNPNLVNCT